MKLATFSYLGEEAVRLGLVQDTAWLDEIVAPGTNAGVGRLPLPPEHSMDSWVVNDTLDELERWASEARPDNAHRIPLESVRLRSPVLAPEKIILVAINYLSHGKERNVAPPQHPYLFTKFRSSLIGPGDPILLPKVSQKVDWEAELAVIIGKRGKYIPKERALDHVAGYTISNDISFRDHQRPPVDPLGMNWVKGKAMDSSFPLGPWLVTKKEIPDPQKLELSLKVNGQERQRANTSEMLFGVDALIEYISAGITLKPGDIISTGTPMGVASGSGQPFLKDGDVVEVTIGGIGSLRNPVRAEA